MCALVCVCVCDQEWERNSKRQKEGDKKRERKSKGACVKKREEGKSAPTDTDIRPFSVKTLFGCSDVALCGMCAAPCEPALSITSLLKIKPWKEKERLQKKHT